MYGVTVMSKGMYLLKYYKTCNLYNQNYYKYETNLAILNTNKMENYLQLRIDEKLKRKLNKHRIEFTDHMTSSPRGAACSANKLFLISFPCFSIFSTCCARSYTISSVFLVFNRVSKLEKYNSKLLMKLSKNRSKDSANY